MAPARQADTTTDTGNPHRPVPSIAAPALPATDLMYLNGPFAPVREEVTAFDLPVTGSIPPGLNGRLLRVGSNPWSLEDTSTYHWFAGSGMVHGLALRDGRALWYRNRWLLDDELARQRGAAPVPGPRAGNRGQHWIDINLNNTTPVLLGGKVLAVSEGGVMPVQIDPETLETLRTEDFGGTFPGAFTGHPHVDPDTGESHAVAYYWEWDHLKYLHFGLDGRVRHTVEIPAPTRPCVHDFAMSARYAIVLDSPLVYDADLAARGFLGLRWRDELPAQFVLVPRAGVGGAIRRVPVPPQCVMHFVNAYDLPDGRLVVDGVSNDRIMKTDRNGPLEGRLSVNRFTIDPAAGTVDVRVISELPQELPRIDDRRWSKPHRYSYAWGVGREGAIVKIDYLDGSVRQFLTEPGTYPSEPVFVPAHAQAGEDEGWLLSYIGDLRSDSSELAILDARKIEAGPVARIRVPQRVPVTFHGNFFPDAS